MHTHIDYIGRTTWVLALIVVILLCIGAILISFVFVHSVIIKKDYKKEPKGSLKRELLFLVPIVVIGLLFFAIENQNQGGILRLDTVQHLQEQIQVFIGLEMGTLQVQEEEAARSLGKHLDLFTDRRQMHAAQRTRQGDFYIVAMVFDLNVN